MALAGRFSPAAFLWAGFPAAVWRPVFCGSSSPGGVCGLACLLAPGGPCFVACRPPVVCVWVRPGPAPPAAADGGRLVMFGSLLLMLNRFIINLV